MIFIVISGGTNYLSKCVDIDQCCTFIHHCLSLKQLLPSAQIDGFKNIWNGIIPTEFEITLEFMIDPDNYANNNWVNCFYCYTPFLQNQDDYYDSTFIFYLYINDFARTYTLTVDLWNTMITSQVTMASTLVNLY